MIKFILIFACIVLLGSTHAHMKKFNATTLLQSSVHTETEVKHINTTETDNYVPPSFVEVKRAINATHHSGKGTPSSLVQMQTTQVTAPALSKDHYGCPQGWRYLSYADETANRQAVCSKLTYWGIARLQGGGSADGQGYDCRSRSSDPRGAGHAVCVQTSVDSRSKGTGEDCGAGLDRATTDEVAANKQAYCGLLASWDIARVGLRGSLSGSSYGCELRDWDDRGLGHSVCVKRSLTSIQEVSVNEDICGSGKTLLTAEEAMKSRTSICSLLPYWGIARLSGGGSMDGQGYGCKVRSEDTRGLGHGVCGTAGRA